MGIRRHRFVPGSTAFSGLATETSLLHCALLLSLNSSNFLGVSGPCLGSADSPIQTNTQGGYPVSGSPKLAALFHTPTVLCSADLEQQGVQLPSVYLAFHRGTFKSLQH